MICGEKLKVIFSLFFLALLPSVVYSQQFSQAEKKELLNLIEDLDNENKLLMTQLQDMGKRLTEAWNELRKLEISLGAQKADNQELMKLWNEEKSYTTELQKSLTNKENESIFAWTSAGVSAIAFVVSLLVH